MSSFATDFLSNLLASRGFGIWGQDSGVVTDEHGKIFVDERISVMGETTQEEDRTERGGEGQGEQGTGGVTQGRESIHEYEGSAEASTRHSSRSRSPIREERSEEAVQPQSGLGSGTIPGGSSEASPQTPMTGEGISNNPEPGTPDRARGSSTPPINPSGSQAESSTQAEPTTPTGAASDQSPSALPLPEDDGMRALRERVLHIQIKDIPTDEKARLMHELLTEGYTKSQVGQETKPSTVPPSPATIVSSQERPTTPTSISSFNFWPGKDSSPEKGDTVTFHLSQDDLKPTYAPLPPPAEGVSDGSDDVEQTQLKYALTVLAALRTTTVTFAIFGRTIRIGVFITAMTAGYVESARGLGRTSSIARPVASA
ncbi:hypothetical protein V492_06577 [Pseudogymnoascus sp. VKM F-4246]|nr:hypothetical protein V492_06577 [Pseudogymnoascus sp. VKM F-4246]